MASEEARPYCLTPMGQELAMTCYRLAHQMARKYVQLRLDRSGRDSKRHFDSHIDDFAQEAMMALCNAASDFDQDRGNKFITLAYKHIKMRLQREGELGFHPLGPGWVYAATGRWKGRISITYTSELIPGWHGATIEEFLESGVNLSERLHPLVGTDEWKHLKGMVPPRWWDVLMRRMGDYTLQEIGEALGISRERVRQIEAQALKRLRMSKVAERLMFDV